MIDSQATAALWSVKRTILMAGLAAAVLEMLVVLPIRALMGISPLAQFQWIASGWQGDAASAGGIASALFGAALHLSISIVAAGIFVYASRIWPVLLQRSLSAGLIYGALVYAVMTYGVVPLSAVRLEPATDGALIAARFAAHLCFFGLPISLVTRFASLRSRFS